MLKGDNTKDVCKTGSAGIANRLKRALSSLINEDQTGFMADKSIGEYIRLIYDLISYLQRKFTWAASVPRLRKILYFSLKFYVLLVLVQMLNADV